MDQSTRAFLYATSKLDAVTILSASWHIDMVQEYNMGFIGTAYTAAHEAMELLLKVYLREAKGWGEEETKGHDLGKLFMMWDHGDRLEAELEYQSETWRYLSRHGLKARDVRSICKAVYRGGLTECSFGAPAWYPEEVLSIKLDRLHDAVVNSASLGFIEAFLSREGSQRVFEGWRYLSEGRLEELGLTFHGPPIKMIVVARCLEGIVWRSVRKSPVLPS